jgi:hypothetical protein
VCQVGYLQESSNVSFGMLLNDSQLRRVYVSWWMNEWIWSTEGMILTEEKENESSLRKTCPTATLSTTRPTQTYLRLNQTFTVRSQWLTTKPWHGPNNIIMRSLCIRFHFHVSWIFFEQNTHVEIQEHTEFIFLIYIISMLKLCSNDHSWALNKNAESCDSLQGNS